MDAVVVVGGLPCMLLQSRRSRLRGLFCVCAGGSAAVSCCTRAVAGGEGTPGGLSGLHSTCSSSFDGDPAPQPPTKRARREGGEGTSLSDVDMGPATGTAGSDCAVVADVAVFAWQQGERSHWPGLPLRCCCCCGPTGSYPAQGQGGGGSEGVDESRARAMPTLGQPAVCSNCCVVAVCCMARYSHLSCLCWVLLCCLCCCWVLLCVAAVAVHVL